MKLLFRECCPLCRSTSGKPFRKGTIDPADLSPADFRITDNHYGSLWNFKRCGHCGFVYSDPTIPRESIAEFYCNLDDQEYGKEESGRAKNFATILNRLEKLPLPGKKLLDVGAASGIFLSLAKNRGYSVKGIEPAKQLVSEAREKYGLTLFCGTLEQFPETEKFHIITCLDLIEHLVEPADFLSQVSSRLEPGGILIIVTPDIDSLAARIFASRWWHFRTAHLNFFNFRALNHILNKTGFKVIEKKRYAWNFSIFYLVTRILPFAGKSPALQKILKPLNLKLQLFDSWEIYAQKN